MKRRTKHHCGPDVCVLLFTVHTSIHAYSRSCPTDMISEVLAAIAMKKLNSGELPRAWPFRYSVRRSAVTDDTVIIAALWDCVD